jgi:hypothetical protein
LALTFYNADPKHPAQLYELAGKEAGLLLHKQPDGFEGKLLRGALDMVDKSRTMPWTAFAKPSS